MPSSDIKVGKTVQARTVRGTEYVAGKVTAVSTGPTGAWYTIKTKAGEFRTRRACIK